MDLVFRTYLFFLSTVILMSCSLDNMEDVGLQEEDITVISALETADIDCGADLRKNVMVSEFLNFDGITWDTRTRKDNTFFATHLSQLGTDSLVIEFPFILDGVKTKYLVDVRGVANNSSEEKVPIRPSREWSVIAIADATSDSIRVTLCNVGSMHSVANKTVQYYFDANLTFPR